MYMISTTLQQIIDERISFLKEQINPANKPEVNKTFQIQIDVIRSATANNDIEKVESLILQKKEQLKNSNDVYESDRIFAELDGLEWLQRQMAVYAFVDHTMRKGVNTKI
jgi:plasmid maintenance system killer protein